jgi:hypothetical protein
MEGVEKLASFFKQSRQSNTTLVYIFCGRLVPLLYILIGLYQGNKLFSAQVITCTLEGGGSSSEFLNSYCYTSFPKSADGNFEKLNVATLFLIL